MLCFKIISITAAQSSISPSGSELVSRPANLATGGSLARAIALAFAFAVFNNFLGELFGTRPSCCWLCHLTTLRFSFLGSAPFVVAVQAMTALARVPPWRLVIWAFRLDGAVPEVRGARHGRRLSSRGRSSGGGPPSCGVAPLLAGGCRPARSAARRPALVSRGLSVDAWPSVGGSEVDGP